LGPFAAIRVRAQPTPHGQPAGKVTRIGVVLFSTPQTEPNFTAFVAGLRDLGYVEGRNIAFEHRYAEGHPERFRDLALQTVGSNPDVIVVLGGDMVPFVRDATRTIPVVMLTSDDPVESRLNRASTGSSLVSITTG